MKNIKAFIVIMLCPVAFSNATGQTGLNWEIGYHTTENVMPTKWFPAKEYYKGKF